jgi:CubicO group peptidase (beta-lactamase class C family)
MRIRTAVAALLASALLTMGCASRGRTVPETRANRVERDLLPNVRVSGRHYVSATIADRMREYRVPAVTVAVIDGGRIAWAHAYGMADTAEGRPATPTTLFQAASMSKPVASTAALQLVQEGALTLDTAVNQQLRSWQIPASRFTKTHPVTLRHLLSHTGGLNVSGFPGYASDAAIPTVIQILQGVPPANTPALRVEAAPGGTHVYSGGGMTVMQLLLTEVTGKQFVTLMRERVLVPAGMSASTFEQPLADVRAHEAATGYRITGEPVVGRYHTYPEMAAAGLWTTATDLARWILDIQNSLAGKGRLLSRTMASHMVTSGVGGWGLGVEVEGSGDTLRFQHGGANAGFRGQFVAFVHQSRGAVVMTNSDAGGRLGNEIVHAIAREYNWPGFDSRIITPVALSTDAVGAYVGTYASRDGPRVQIAAEGARIWLTLPWGERRELMPIGEDRFESPEGGAGRFVREAGVGVTAVLLGSERLDRVP